MSAYRDLATCRTAEGPIPWWAVRLYAKDAGLDPDVGVILWDVTRAMCTAERQWVAKQTKKPGDTSG